jgi:hypothetical protein
VDEKQTGYRRFSLSPLLTHQARDYEISPARYMRHPNMKLPGIFGRKVMPASHNPWPGRRERSEGEPAV